MFTPNATLYGSTPVQILEERDNEQQLVAHADGSQSVMFDKDLERGDKIPLDVWLKLDSEDEDAPATHEANTYRDDTWTEGGYRIEWYLNSVGLVTSVYFDTIKEVHAWYEKEGFQDFSS